MKKHWANAVSITLLALLTALTIWQDIKSDFHPIVVHMYYVFVVFFAFWFRKWLLWATGYLVVMHLVLDMIKNDGFPYQALAESILLVMLALFLHFTFINQEKSETIAKLFHQIADDSIFGQVITNLEGRIVYANPYFAKLCNLKPDNIINMELSSFSVSEMSNSFRELLMILAKEGYSNEIDLVMSCPDGRRIPLFASGVVINDPEGKPKYYAVSALDITAEKNLAADLDRNKRRLESIIEAIRVGTWEWNIEQDIIVIDDRWAEILGYEKSELEPMTIEKWYALVHPDDRETVAEALKQIFARKEEYYEVVIRIFHKRGNIVWIQERGKVTEWSDSGKPVLMMGTHTDITTLKTAEEELKYSHRLMQYVIENANAAIAIHDKNMNYMYVSQSYLRQYEVKTQDIIGKNHYEVFPDLPQKWRDVHQRTLKGEIIKADMDIYVREDSREFWTRWESRPWYELDGSIGGLIIYTEVINERLEREKQVQESQELLKKVLDNLPLGIALGKMHPEMTIKYMNGNFTSIYGITPKDLERPYSFWDKVFDDPIFRDRAKKTFEDELAKKDVRNNWHRISLKNKALGTRYVDSYVSTILDGEYLVSIVNDVTDQVKKQEEIERISMHDSLTEMYNRAYFTSRLGQMDGQMNLPLSIMLIDINGLKLINDAFGFARGDQTIIMVAETIKKTVKTKSAPLARLGGGEFGIILAATGNEAAIVLKREILEAVAKLRIANIEIGLAIGLATMDEKNKTLQELLKEAEDDMLKRKVLSGRGIRNSAITGIFKTLTEKYDEEKTHSQRVSAFCRQIGEAMKLGHDDVKELELAGLFHDIGKISLRDDVLKKPGKLTEEEYTEVKKHTEIGYQILRAADKYSGLAEHALCHHERWDGTGYPNRLKGEDIPLFSRIISVADAFEAMTSDRPYRKANKIEFAVDELLRNSGTQFDPQIVDIFVRDVLKVRLGMD